MVGFPRRRTGDDVDAKRDCPSGDALAAYAEGLLEESDRAAVEAHLGSCERCRGFLSDLRDIHRTLRAAGRDRGRAADRCDGGGARVPGDRCPEDELLAAYADGSLGGRREAEVERHLARCPSCLAEVADLMSLAGAPGFDVPDRTVKTVLARLDRERKTAVVRLAERSVVLVRDFVQASLPGGRRAPFDAAVPAFASARSDGAPVRLRWSGGGDLEVECDIRRTEEGATLTGRATSAGEPARATSVTLVTAGGTWGPESPDSRGRFGPWPLPAGESRLFLAGDPDGDGAVELSIEVETKPSG